MANFLHKSFICSSHGEPPPNLRVSIPSSEILAKEEGYGICLPVLMRKSDGNIDLARVRTLPHLAFAPVLPSLF